MLKRKVIWVVVFFVVVNMLSTGFGNMIKDAKGETVISNKKNYELNGIVFSEEKDLTFLGVNYLSKNSNDGIEIAYRLTLSDCKLLKEGYYDYLEIKNHQLLTRPCEPVLPMKTITLTLPYDTEVLDVGIVNGNYREILSELNIVPTPQPKIIFVDNVLTKTKTDITNNWGIKGRIDFSKYPEQWYSKEPVINNSKSVYDSINLFPGSIFSYEVGKNNENTYVYLRIYPVQYIPKERKVFLVTDITFRVLCEKGDKRDLKSLDSCLIITSPLFYLEALRLKNFHSQHNVSSTIVNTTYIYENIVSTEDPPYEGYKNSSLPGWSDIKNYNYTLAKRIINFLRGYDGKYVVLFGNAGIIPPSYYIYDSTLQGWYGAYNDWIPTDFFYASPDYDLVPNFKIGRIPVGSNSEANHFVNKVTNWTKFLSVDWFANITLAGGRPFFTPFFVGEMSCIHATEYLSGRIRKCFRTDDTFNEENLKNVFSGEEGIVYHMGHGSGDSIWLETGFWEEDELNASEIMALPQSSKTPIVISVACMNGAFDTDLMKFSWNPFNLSFGEALIKSNAGGISYIGGSRINFGGWNVIFKNGSMHILKEPYMQGMCIDMIRAVNKSSSLGELFEKGITYYVEENDFSDKINNRTLFGTVLLGDPTLPIIKGNGSKYKTYSNITNPYKYVNASKHVYPNFNRTWAGCIGDIPVVLDENVTIECFTSSPKSLIKVVDTDRYGNYTIVKKTEINNFVEKIRLNTSSLYIIRIISDDENETWVYVLRASVIFSDISEDYVVDKDNNGFYDYLQIDVNLTVNKTGGYGVFGVLVVESGGWWWYINSAWLWVILENGMQTVSFKFNGDNIKERINLYNEFGKEWGFNISGNTSFILYTYVLNEEWKLFDYTFTSTSEYNYTRFGVSKNANLKGVIYNSTGNTTEAFIFTYDKETNYRNYTWVNETGKYSINLYPGTFDVIVIGWDENNINDKVFKINVLQDETKIMNIFLPAMRSDNVNEHFNLSSWDDLNLRWLVSWGWLNYTMRWQIDAFLGDDDGNVSEKEKERYKTYVYWYINAWLEFCSGRLKIFGFYVDEREYAIYSINDFSFDIKNLTGIWMSDSPITFDEKIGCKSTKTVPLNQTHKVKLRINYDSKYASYIYRIKYPLPYVMVSYTGENISVSGDNEVVIDPLEYDLWYDWIEMNVTSKDLSSPVINFTPPDTINANTLIPLYANVTDNYYTPDKLIVTAYVNSHPQPMNYVSGNLFSTVIGPFGIGNVKLYIEAKDLSNNTNTTPLIVLEVVDLINPIANGGSDQLVDEDTVVTFDGSASSDNVEIVNYTWTFFDGVWQILYGVSPTYIFYTPGIYVVTLNVSDAAGNWHTDEVIITVMDITPPVANASSDQLVDEDTTVHFDGSASFDNVGIVNYTWTFNDQGTVIILHGVNPWYVFNQPGTYVVTLNVSDAAGNWVVDIVNITVRDITLPKITNLRASPAVQTQNSYVNITCAVEDNVAVSATNVTIKGPVGFAPINITMAKVGNAEYYYNLSYSIAGEYSYYIWVVDISGNGNKSAEYYFIITIAVKRTIEDREVNVVGIGNGTVSIEPTSLPQIPPEKLHNITCIKVTITGTLTYVNITIRYTEEDVAGLNESTLIMYYWDATEGKWKSCNEIGSTGADVENNIVWANVTSLTIFAPMAEKVPEIMPAPVNRLLYIGIGAIVVILAVFVAIAKRKKKLKGAE